MTKTSIWILASRPRTLMLSIAPVLMGGAIAFADGLFHTPSFWVAMASALLIQVGTNFCNDYFDFKKGADTAERLGPTRMTQAGLVAPDQMKNAFLFVFAMAALLGIYLVDRGGWPVLLAGFLSIVSGALYTAGPFSLAYVGGAELFVVAFFGPVAVLGTYYVQALQWSNLALVAGFSPGLLSMAVLCVNNLRDRPQDFKANKKTLAVRFGESFAKSEYVVAVILASLIPLLLYLYWDAPLPILLSMAIGLCALPLMRRVCFFDDARVLNQVLAKTGQLVLLFAVTFSLSLVL